MATLRVMTYNILEGGGDRIEDIASIIEHAQADIIAIQEANHESQFYDLARTLGLHGIIGHGNHGFHVGLLSRYYISEWRNHPERLVFHHTLLEAHLETPLGPIAFFVTHLYPGYDPSGEDRRLAEVGAILSHMMPQAGEKQLLAGDFNTLSPTDVLELAHWPQQWQARIRELGGTLRRDAIRAVLDAGYIDCFRAIQPAPGEPGYTRARGHKFGYTLPAPTPNVRLDYIFASPDLAANLVGCDVVATDEARTASDHLPVVAQFGHA